MSNLSGTAETTQNGKLLMELSAAFGSFSFAKRLFDAAHECLPSPIIAFDSIVRDGELTSVLMWNDQGMMVDILINQLSEPDPAKTIHLILTDEVKVQSAFSFKSRPNRLFRFVDLASRILPHKVWTEAFEPHFEDSKASYLRAKRTYKGKWERKWLAFCFVFQSFIALVQSLGAMVNEKFKKALWATFGGVVMWFKG